MARGSSGDEKSLAASLAASGRDGSDYGSVAGPARASPRRKPADDLPDLKDRIEKMGLGSAYNAYRYRYQVFQKGDRKGMKKDITHQQSTRMSQFGYWYPTVQEWMWRRTLSFWIAVSMFEGSIFFATSSFLYNFPDKLGRLYQPLTFGGYCAGKFLFFVCCYFMCLETVNFQVDDMDSEEAPRRSEPRRDPYTYWPYNYRRAVEKLTRAGLTPLPYWTAVLYLTGVFVFCIGMGSHCVPHIAEKLLVSLVRWSFLVGSLFFAFGGVTECLQNNVFSTRPVEAGWWGAVSSLVGSLFFFAGSVFSWINSSTSMNFYGIGSLLFALSSSIQIIMWKDEQYGLAFLGAINGLGSRRQRDKTDVDGHNTFSLWGAILVHVWCWLGNMSTYNLLCQLVHFQDLGPFRAIQLSFNEILPCLLAHLLLLLNSAVVRPPETAPFKHLYLLAQLLAILLTINATSTFFTELAKYNVGSPLTRLAHWDI